MRTRREALDPTTAGIGTTARRHAKGWRREEVSELAQIGACWYTWLEQGRPINISDEALLRITQALRLNGEETAYVFGLADKLLPAEASDRVVVEAPASILATMEAYGGSAMAVNYRFDLLGWNRLAGRIFHLEPGIKGIEANYVWRLYNDPVSKSHFRNWRDNAASITAIFRMTFAFASARRDGDQYVQLLEALSTNDEFRSEWSLGHQRIGRPASIMLALDVEPVGPFDVNSVRFTLPTLPGIMVFFQSAFDDRGRDAFRLLAE